MRRKNDAPPESGPTHAVRGKKKTGTPEVGNALRSVYQQTVDEDIPPEMLDLLGKLG
ncbi:MAG TPA: NepR family anti-sigma factor [Allosphingosinicella sp.]